jgi:hypothetical protein
MCARGEGDVEVVIHRSVVKWSVAISTVAISVRIICTG